MFKDSLKRYRKLRQMTQEQLADAIGVAKSTISMYENGNREPDFETIEAIADVLNINFNSLVSHENITENIPFGFEPLPKFKKIPRLGTISCGEPIMSEENFDGYDTVPENIHCDFSLKCEGDSMTGARILDGDIVYIRQQSIVENGEIAAILVDGAEKLLKRVYMNSNSITLQAENPKYPPLVFVAEEMNRVSIIGKAVGFFSKIM